MVGIRRESGESSFSSFFARVQNARAIHWDSPEKLGPNFAFGS
jgi:hypothetical protein